MLSLLLTIPLLGQSGTNFNNWLVYSGDHALHGKWGWRAESHLRRSDGLRTWQQIMARTGPTYQLSPRFSVATAYHYLRSYRYGANPAPTKQDEHRLGSDIAWRESLRRFTLAQRGRFENRWISRPNAGRFYENRLRYQTRVTMPFQRGYYGAVYQEVFMPVPPETHPRRVDQLRLGAAVGKRLNEAWRAEFGYMYQGLWQRNGRIRVDNHTLVFTFLHSRR
ncbi:MAG: DUF2490 domain-containing protein [Bryobacteraceae bacterium]|nr:DUF2490 domain-containing protein [Bryobacteraceae bacterium]